MLVLLVLVLDVVKHHISGTVGKIKRAVYLNLISICGIMINAVTATDDAIH
jgi:hypothetical protein